MDFRKNLQFCFKSYGVNHYANDANERLRARPVLARVEYHECIIYKQGLKGLTLSKRVIFSPLCTTVEDIILAYIKSLIFTEDSPLIFAGHYEKTQDNDVMVIRLLLSFNDDRSRSYAR